MCIVVSVQIILYLAVHLLATTTNMTTNNIKVPYKMLYLDSKSVTCPFRACNYNLLLCHCERLRTKLTDYAALTSGCACPGDTLTYECTVMGEPTGATVWSGSALNCSYHIEIVLLHSHFSSTYGTLRVCNNGATVGRSLSVEGNNYTSQLNVTVTPDTTGKTIACLYDNGWSLAIQFSTVLPTTGLSSCIAITSQAGNTQI